MRYFYVTYILNGHSNAVDSSLASYYEKSVRDVTTYSQTFHLPMFRNCLCFTAFEASDKPISVFLPHFFIGSLIISRCFLSDSFT
jgi:hypothetical protein